MLFTLPLVVTMILLSVGFVLYPQDSANTAKFCAVKRVNSHGAP
jgi:hypothetical protein